MTLAPTSSSLARGRAQLAGSTADDAALLDLWVRSKRKSEHTRSSYRARGARFLAWCAEHGVTLRTLTLDDLLRYAESLPESLSLGSQKTHLASVKALLTFGQEVGYLEFNAGAALEVAASKDTLAERILEEEGIVRMLAGERDAFKHLLIRILYASGGRVSEVVRLQWRDAIKVGNAGQLTIVGKGGETRYVKLKKEAWAELMRHRPADAAPDGYIFATKHGKPIARSWAWTIVKAAAKRAGLPENVSPHWMRHAHASHAQAHGAPPVLVMETLGHKSLATTTRYSHARKAESSSDYLPV